MEPVFKLCYISLCQECVCGYGCVLCDYGDVICIGDEFGVEGEGCWKV